MLLALILFSVFIPSEQSCNTLITDLSQETCHKKQNGNDTYYYWQDDESCIPKCKKYDLFDYFGQSCPCPPPYVCDYRCIRGAVSDSLIKCTPETVKADCPSVRNLCRQICVVDDGIPCMAYHARTGDYVDNAFSAMKFKPTCTNDGAWAAKQCKGGISGRCFCFDSKGRRLFGQAKYRDAKDMTCACSRKRADLIAAGRKYVSFHCDSMGNYEKLQCDSGLCWCVEPKTGDVTSPVLPEKAIVNLPCYKVADIGGQYLRQCDSVKYAVSKIEDLLYLHGVTYANFGTKLCDGDGAFGAYNMSGGIAYCTWRDGTKIGTWQSETTTNIRSLSCNCARDYKMYAHGLTCDGAGNYLAVQSFIKDEDINFYCVDSDGFAKSNIFPERLDNCTSYY